MNFYKCDVSEVEGQLELGLKLQIKSVMGGSQTDAGWPYWMHASQISHHSTPDVGQTRREERDMIQTILDTGY